MKGIEAIIAVILLLLITISVVGFAFLFFSRITATAGAAAENQTAQQLIQFSKQVGIDTFTTLSVAVRNTGSGTIARSEITVYVDGAPKTCTWAPNTDFASGDVRTCTFVGACNAGSKIRVAGPANTADQSC